jgi:hypothetical protein
MGDDFRYNWSVIPNDSQGWQRLRERGQMNNWIMDAVVHKHDEVFFRVPWSKQLSLQNTNPTLAEAWNHYLTLLAVLENSEDDH